MHQWDAPGIYSDGGMVGAEIQSKQGMEDIPKVESAFDCPAPIVLKLTFRMRKEEIDDLYDFAKKLISDDTSNK